MSTYLCHCGREPEHCPGEASSDDLHRRWLRAHYYGTVDEAVDAYRRVLESPRWQQR
jgi:hypothetical protein